MAAKQQKRKPIEPVEKPPKRQGKEKTLLEKAMEQAEIRDMDALLAAARERGDFESAEYLHIFLKDIRGPGPGASALKSVASEASGTESELIVDQVNWIRRTGETPLEFLTRIYRNPLLDVKDRISAARATQDYVHQKMPSVSVLKQGDGDGKRSITGIREKLIARLTGLAKGVEPSVKGSKQAGDTARGSKR